MPVQVPGMAGPQEGARLILAGKAAWLWWKTVPL